MCGVPMGHYSGQKFPMATNDTTLGLLRELEQRGAMPERYNLGQTYEGAWDIRLWEGPCPVWTMGNLGLSGEWRSHAVKRFIVALQIKLVGIDIVTELRPDVDGTGCEYGARDLRRPGSTQYLGPDTPEGLMRAALAVLETR